jgi:hypothetical protein
VRRRARSCSCASATDEIDSALGHAADFGARDHATVERILAARALPRTLDEYVAEDTARHLEETLGYARTVPRDLTEYDRLPLTSASRSRTEETKPWQSEPPVTEANRESVDKAMTTSSSRDSDDTSNSSG